MEETDQRPFKFITKYTINTKHRDRHFIQDERVIKHLRKNRYLRHQIGDKINQYILIAQINQGMNSLIWLVFDIQKNEHFVMKMIRSSNKANVRGDDSHWVTQIGFDYIKERIQHRVKGQYYTYIIMDILGPSLDDICKHYNGQFYIGQQFVKSIFIQVFQQLDQIHQKKIIHTDLKLDNIVIKNIDKQKYIENFYAKYLDGDVQFFYPMTMYIQNENYSQQQSNQYSEESEKSEESKESKESEESSLTSQESNQSGEEKTEEILDETVRYMDWYGMIIDLKEPYEYQIIDFGNALAFETDETEIGAFILQPPESLLQQKITYKSDIYQAGCIMFEMLTDQDLFSYKRKSKDDISTQLLCQMIMIQLQRDSQNNHKIYQIHADHNQEELKLKLNFITEKQFLKDYFTQIKHGYHKLKTEELYYPLDLYCELEKTGLPEQEEVDITKDFILNLIHFDPSQRYDALQSLKHQFFTSVSNEINE